MYLFSQKMIISLLGIFFLCMLQGCTRTIFGVDEDVWKTLSPAERENVIAGYNERQRIYQEQEPARKTIAALSDLNQSLKQKNDIKIQKMEHELKLKQMEQHAQKTANSPSVVQNIYTSHSEPTLSSLPKTAPSFLQVPFEPLVPPQNSINPVF